MPGRSTVSTTPASALKIPSSTTTSQYPHPPSCGVCLKYSETVSIAISSQKTVPSRLAMKLPRYCSSSSQLSCQNARNTDECASDAHHPPTAP